MKLQTFIILTPSPNIEGALENGQGLLKKIFQTYATKLTHSDGQVVDRTDNYIEFVEDRDQNSIVQESKAIGLEFDRANTAVQEVATKALPLNPIFRCKVTISDSGAERIIAIGETAPKVALPTNNL